MNTQDASVTKQEILQVVDSYLTTGSVNLTARETGFSTVKVRKILITED